MDNMLVAAAVFVISFIQNYLATNEVYAIARNRRIGAAAWAGVSACVGFSFLMVVIKVDRWYLMVPYVLGDVIATYLALGKRGQP